MSHSHPHRRTTSNRKLRLERCEDRALLAGDAMLGAALEFAPVTELSLVYDSGYIAQDRMTVITNGGNLYQFDANNLATRSTVVQGLSFKYDNVHGANKDWTSLPSIDFNDSAYTSSAGSASDLEFGPGADDDAAGLLNSPQIPVIPTVEEVANAPNSPALPTETISLARVLRDEPPLAPDAVVRIASEQSSPSVTADKPAFLKIERHAALSPDAIETLDRAFALEGLELEATSAERPAITPNGAPSLPHQPPRASVRSLERLPTVTQTSFTLPTLPSQTDASSSDESGVALTTSDDLANNIPPTWPAYLFSKARQTGSALALGTVAIAIRLRWQRAEEELPQRSLARKFPNA
jgi:hypothetical protein